MYTKVLSKPNKILECAVKVTDAYQRLPQSSCPNILIFLRVTYPANTKKVGVGCVLLFRVFSFIHRKGESSIFRLQTEIILLNFEMKVKMENLKRFHNLYCVFRLLFQLCYLKLLINKLKQNKCMYIYY